MGNRELKNDIKKKAIELKKENIKLNRKVVTAKTELNDLEEMLEERTNEVNNGSKQVRVGNL